MKQPILFLFLLFLIVPSVFALKDYGEGTYGISLYGQIAEDAVEGPAGGHVGGTGIGAVESAKKKAEEEIEEEFYDTTFFKVMVGLVIYFLVVNNNKKTKHKKYAAYN